MPEPSTRVAALLAREANIIQALPVDMVPLLSDRRSGKISVIEGTRSHQLELNNAKAPFNDMRVRMALNYGIDWEKIVKTVYGGHGRRLATCFLPSGFGHNPELRPYPYDPEKAAMLLEKAGYAPD